MRNYRFVAKPTKFERILRGFGIGTVIGGGASAIIVAIVTFVK